MRNCWSRLVVGVAAVTMVMLFNSCDKEKPVTPPAKVETVQIPMGKDYANQYFFKLSSNSVVSDNVRDSWDLAFESSTDGYHIYLNGAKFMFAYSTGKSNFDSTYTFNNAKQFTWVDQPSGNVDSTAIGEWCTFSNGTGISRNQVYLVDRGKTVANIEKGKCKIVFQQLADGVYSLKYADLDGSNQHTVEITKDAIHKFVYLSLENGGQQVTVAPDKVNWDLEFTMYTHVFDTTPPGIPIAVKNFPYLVNGVLLNPNTVSISKDNSNSVPFDSVTLSMAQNATYTTRWDAIGYDWKTFDFADEDYTITANQKYFIKTSDGKYYKLRFTDFYDKNGLKGYPTFQFQLLQ